MDDTTRSQSPQPRHDDRKSVPTIEMKVPEPEGESEELRLLLEAIMAYELPRRVLLFGSRARKEARPESDIDLCVIYDRLPKRKLEVLQDLYASIFKIPGHPVDLIVYQEDSFEERALRSGTLESVIQTEGRAVYG